MSGAAFLRVAKLKGAGIIRTAARHNKREIQAELGATGSINPMRSRLNYYLVGPSTADAVAQMAKDLMSESDVTKVRKNGVVGIEIVFSLPLNHGLDDRAYFGDCVTWAGQRFGGAHNILSADVHNDEGAPHCHVLLLPLRDGRMVGHALCGGPKEVLAMQKHFHETVAKPYGLRKAPARLTGAGKQAAAAVVLARLRATGDAALQSEVWATMREVIEAAPEQFMAALGLVLDAPKKKVKPFVDFVTSKGRGPKHEARQQNAISVPKPNKTGCENAISFVRAGGEKTQPICSVSVPKNTAPFHPQKAPEVTLKAPAKRSTSATGQVTDSPSTPASSQAESNSSGSHAESTTPRSLRVVNGQSTDDSDGVTRERDGEHDAGLWCPERGEFITAPLGASRPPPRGYRAGADSWVASELEARGKAPHRSPFRPSTAAQVPGSNRVVWLNQI